MVPDKYEQFIVSNTFDIFDNLGGSVGPDVADLEHLGASLCFSDPLKSGGLRPLATPGTHRYTLTYDLFDFCC